LTPVAKANAALTGTVTVKWNTQAVGSITLVGQYNGAPVGSHNLGAETIYAALNGGAGNACTLSDTEPAGAPVVNFGNVTPDATVFTDCMEVNALDSQVVTNDTTGWKVAEQATAGIPAGTNFELCSYPNGGTFPFGNVAALPATASARAAAVINTSTTACSGGGNPIFASGASAAFTLNTTNTNAFTAATPANFGEDYELVLGPSAPSGAQSVTVTYTLTLL
ncbi:MAG: hypothetical protein ACYDA1_09340, partial [Vulcanimicrobiaceae bacterium]